MIVLNQTLYYWFNGKTICFSCFEAIIEHPNYEIDVDLKALNEYFTFQNIFSYNTLFKGVNMLPPANTVKISSKIDFVNIILVTMILQKRMNQCHSNLPNSKKHLLNKL